MNRRLSTDRVRAQQTIYSNNTNDNDDDSSLAGTSQGSISAVNNDGTLKPIPIVESQFSNLAPHGDPNSFRLRLLLETGQTIIQIAPKSANITDIKNLIIESNTTGKVLFFGVILLSPSHVA